MPWYRTLTFRIALSVLVFWLLTLPMFRAHDWWTDYWFEAISPLMTRLGKGIASNGVYMIGFAIEFTAPMVIALFLFHRTALRPKADGYTRCGKCTHILKGLTEPRCPECGDVL